MDFRKYLRERLWLLPLLAVVAFIATDTVIHVRITYRISSQHIGPPPMPDNSSPTGYVLGQRDIVLPYTGMDGYHWIMQTQQMFATGDLRIRHVDYDNYDNGPKGREVHWASAFRWWAAGLAWIDHFYSGVPIPIAVEDVMPFANTLLITLLLFPLAPILTRRFGLGAASLVIVGMGFILPVYESFSEGKSDHHGLAALNALLTLLFLLGGGAGWVRNPAGAGELSPFFAWLPDRAQAKRWFIASGVVGGFGLWISTASEAPALAEIGLAAFVATGWLGYNTQPEDGAHPDPSLWRVWGWAGAATSVFFYLLEYFPSHMEMRLEVNNPLYAAAWAGGCEIIYRICRWWNGGRLVEQPRDCAWLGFGLVAVAAVPLIIHFFGDQVFWVNDRFLFTFHEDYIAEFKDIRRYLDPMYSSGSARYMLAVVNCLPLLTIPMLVWMWRRMRIPVLAAIACGIPLCAAAYVVLHLHSTSEVDFIREYHVLLIPAALLVEVSAIVCLVLPRWENVTLLATLALGLFGYCGFMLMFQNYLAQHPADWPLDYYFWPFETVPLLILFTLLFIWEPWGEFPRPALGIMLLALAPILITTALSVREMRWMELLYSMLLATLAALVCLLGRLRNYRWNLLPIALLAGVLTLVLGELELHWGQLGQLATASYLSVTQASLHNAPHLALTVAVVALILVMLGLAVGIPLGQRWRTLLHAGVLMLLPPVTLAVLLGLFRTGWPGPNGAPWVAAILVVLLTISLQPGYSWKTAARTFTAAIFLGVVFLPSPTLTMVDWLTWAGAVPMSDVELMEVVTRDVSQHLRAQMGNKTAVVVSGPTTTTWMIYWGNFKGLGDLYWENLEGLKADRDIYAAQSPDAAYKLIKARGVTHIAIYSFDPFYKEYARLALNVPRPFNPDDYAAEKPLHDWLDDLKGTHEAPKDEVEAEKPLLDHSFIYDLIEKTEIPNWLRVIYYPMPGDPQLRGQYALLFEVVPPQSPEAAATNLADFHYQRGDYGNCLKYLNIALNANPNYLPALICAARLDVDRKNTNELNLLLARIRTVLPLDNSVTLKDRINLAMVFVLNNDSSDAKQQIVAALPLAKSDTVRQLDLEQTFNFLSFIKQAGLQNARPGLSGFLFDQLPDAQRGLYLFDAGQIDQAANPAAAISYFQRALALDPNSVPVLTKLASLLATAHDPALRDGKSALADALHAREFDHNKTAATNDALACAYAESGDFTDAEIFEQLAARQARSSHADADAAAYDQRVQLFRNHQPFHQ